MKIGYLLSLFQRKNRTENAKMLLQNNCVNNVVTNGFPKEGRERDGA